MSKPIQISIPQPCHEKWAEMTPVDKGRFCASCQKNVIDFIRASDREIAKAISKNKNLCGRFTPNQLERDLIVSKEKSSLWVAAGAAVLTFLTIGNETVSAQTPVNTEQTDSKTDDKKSEKNVNEMLVITGIVSDEIGPVPETKIINKNSAEIVNADINGKYSIKAKKGDILEFSYIGYDVVLIEIKNDTTQNVVFNTPMLIGEVIIIDKYSFFGRIFHSIGNWFK